MLRPEHPIWYRNREEVHDEDIVPGASLINPWELKFPTENNNSTCYSDDSPTAISNNCRGKKQLKQN
jgi:hypothetical protein